MKQVSKSKLKAHMLEIFRDIEESGDELVVTDRDVPVLRVVPIRKRESCDRVFGAFRHRLQFREDPDAPTLDEWTET